jgi:hypothetical protein
MKRLLMIGGSIILALLIAGGSFAGGMAYQRTQTDQIRQQFLQSRGFQGGGTGGFPGAGGNDNNNGGQRRSFAGGFIPGQVKSLDGSVLTLSTAQSVITVNLSDTTKIEKATTGSTTDLQPGLQVLVSGQRDSNGNIAASQVVILGTASQPSANTTP